MKRLAIICLVVIIAVSLTLWPGPSASAESTDGLGDTGDITVTLEADQYEINEVGEYSVIEMKGFGSILNPREPKLPSKTFLIGLPPGAEALSVDMVASDYGEIPGEYRIMPAPPIVSLQENEKVKWGENEEIYSSENGYPSSQYEYLGMGQMRKYNFARVRFCPIVYYPASNKLGLYRSITLKIEYEVSQVVPPELLSDTAMDDVASEIIFNCASMKSKYQSAAAPSPVSYSYVIITTESLQSAVQPLVTWKTTIGYSVNVLTTGWISSSYSGRDLPEKIRNFLIDKYAEWGIDYVLIVGSHSTIPMRYCYPDPSNHTFSPDPWVDGRNPTDYYYADLTGNWDSDGDGYFGEYGQDNVDFYPEVYVGRIPVDNSAMVTSICQKSATFEQDSGSWKKKALLLGAIINYENQDGEGYPKTDGAAVTEECWNDILSGKGYSPERMYEKEGLAPSTYACGHPLTNSNVLNASYGWPSGYGIVNWAAHGWGDSADREVWTSDDNQNGIPEASEMAWPPFIGSSDASSLDDSKPAIVFSDSCLTAYPEETNNLGKSLLQQGAVAFVGATRFSWGTVGWQNEGYGGSGSVDYYFFQYLINQDQKCGDALYHSKGYYLDYFTGGPWASWGWCHWQNMFDFCLYGDPSLGMVSQANNPPQLSSPSVQPPSGTPSTGFYYYVNYYDSDGDSPSVRQAYVDGTAYAMSLQSGSASNGVYRYGPKNLSVGSHNYYFYFEDGKGGTARLPASGSYSGPVVSQENNPPNTPSNPSPGNHATGVSTHTDLSWTGGDPDPGDTVTYAVYFGTSASPPLVSDDQSATTYDPGTLNNNTKYYWKIVATDNHGAPRTGPLWDFTTAGIPGQPDITVFPTSFEVTLPPDTTQDYTLNIGNDGGAALTYNISDQETTGGGGTAGSENLLLRLASTVLETPLDSHVVEPEKAGEAQSGWRNIMTGGFEGAFPGSKWQLYGNPTWGKENYRHHTGSYSAWCAGSSYNPPSDYPNNIEAWMIYGPFSLADATAAELNFYCYMNTQSDHDYLEWLASTDGENFGGWRWSGNSDGWVSESFDLTDVYELGNLCGQSQIWVAFYFESDGMVTDKGAFIDDVVLRKYVGAANNPPNTPSNPSPGNHATGVSTNADLSWTGGDPDPGDTVTYDVYFGTSATPPLVSNHQTATTYDPATLAYSTKYYWKVVATDNHAASTSGPVWDFTTKAAAGDCLWLGESPMSGSVMPSNSDSITVTINTTGLTPGDYSAEIVIANNDPDENPKIVPVTLHVSIANNPPQLSNPSVQPTSGPPSTNFYYYVNYYDSDGDSASVRQVYVDAIPYAMSLYSGTAFNGVYRYGPKNLSVGSHNYYFYFEDGKGGTARLPTSGSYSGPVVSQENNPPNTPSNPSPGNHATGVSINADLSWTGGDPDPGDTVTYAVYFGTSATPPLVSNDQLGTTYDPGTMNNNTKYYWYIAATDNHSASTTGVLWDFTTRFAPPIPCSFGGDVTLDGAACVGSTVEARANGTVVGTATVTADSMYFMVIPQASDTGLPAEGDTLNFFVDGYFGGTDTWEEAGTRTFNLAATTAGEDNPPVPTGLASIEDELVMVYNFDNATKTWTWYNPAWPAQQNTLDTLYKGKVYWVKVSANCTLLYGNQSYALTTGWNGIPWLGY